METGEIETGIEGEDTAGEDTTIPTVAVVVLKGIRRRLHPGHMDHTDITITIILILHRTEGTCRVPTAPLLLLLTLTACRIPP